jgi:drug/metabolite transporter (DMT)-like permease
MQNEKIKIFGGFILAALIWGSTWLVIKLGLESIPPFYAASFRFFIAVCTLSLINLVRGTAIPTDSNSFKIYLIAGLLSFGIPFALVYWGQQYIASGISSILFALYPLIVGVLSHYLLPSEPLNVFKVSGIILGFFGVTMIFARDVQWSTGDVTLGMVAIIISSILQAWSLILIKKHGKDIDAFHLNFGGMLIGFFILLLFALLFENFSDVRLDFRGVGSIFYLGIFGSVVTFSVYFWMLKRVEAVYLSLLSFITPILAVILGGIILNEKLDLHVVYGGTLVLTGVLLTNGKEIFNRVIQIRYKV